MFPCHTTLFGPNFLLSFYIIIQIQLVWNVNCDSGVTICCKNWNLAVVIFSLHSFLRLCALLKFINLLARAYRLFFFFNSDASISVSYCLRSTVTALSSCSVPVCHLIRQCRCFAVLRLEFLSKHMTSFVSLQFD
jgi:hypothetical protein